MTCIRSRAADLVDTCGPGGTGSRTFNISTAAALVAAAAGQPVAKHGNRSVSSRTGSADVLETLGVNIEAPIAQVERCLDELGICFCYAPLMHPSMRHVAPVRRKLGVGTIFNRLGPLCNPAGASFQLLGVARDAMRTSMAEALRQLGVRRAVVVWGEDGLDEVSVGGTTRATEVTAEGLREHRWTPEQFGVPRYPLHEIQVGDARESADRIEGVLSGRPGAARDVVLINAAVALWTVRGGSHPAANLDQVRHAIDSGAATRVLKRWVQLTHSDPSG
jgi:anthranilate phosphoribosyltransferase